MNKKIRIAGIIIISILLVLLISIIVYNVIFLPSIKTKEQEDNFPHVREEKNIKEEIKGLKICKKGIDCNYDTSYYTTISTSLKSTVLTNIIKEINNKVNELYNISNYSTDMTIKECSNVSNLYERSIMTTSNLIIYDSSDIISMTLISNETNLCTLVSNQEINVYLYDVKNDNILTGDDIKKTYDITGEEILTAIKNNIEQININESKNYITNITDYNIYIETDGTIGVYYKQPENNNYYSLLLNKHI